MRRFTVVVTLFVVVLWMNVVAQEQTKTTKTQEGNVTITKTVTKTSYDYNPLYTLGRGFANLGTCPLELPRCMVYDNAVIPVIGLLGGVLEGPFLMTWRLIGGVIDVVSFGFSGSCIYSDAFPDFVWESQWLPKKEKVVIEKTIEKKEK